MSRRKPYRRGIDGMWRKIASAVLEGASRPSEIEKAVHQTKDAPIYTHNRVMTGLEGMIKARLVVVTLDGRIHLTRLCENQLRKAVVYCDPRTGDKVLAPATQTVREAAAEDA